MSFDFRRLDEEVSLESHNKNWKNWYTVEVGILQRIFETTACNFEHIGSTAVKGLVSKPIVDIMIGLEKLELSAFQVAGIKQAEYTYQGRLHQSQESLFAAKRGTFNFNLQIVLTGGTE